MPLPHDHGTHSELLKDHMPEAQTFVNAAELFKKLDDANRLRIFWLLCHCEECVMNISALVEMSSPAVSHHLKQLKDSGLVETARRGREVYYRAAKTESAQFLHDTIEGLLKIACPSVPRE